MKIFKSIKLFFKSCTNSVDANDVSDMVLDATSALAQFTKENQEKITEIAKELNKDVNEVANLFVKYSGYTSDISGEIMEMLGSNDHSDPANDNSESQAMGENASGETADVAA